jgi:long-chain acyl-CoA synthetase
MTLASREKDQVIPDLFEATVDRHRSRIALRQKQSGAWRNISWQEYGEQVRLVAIGLLALGIQRGDRVCIIGANSPEWLFADIGTLTAGGVSVGVYTTSSPVQIEYILNDCLAKLVFVANDALLNKVLAVWGNAPALHHIVVLDGQRRNDARILSLDKLRDLARRFDAHHPEALRDVRGKLDASDMATLVYTSGTTGPPKGAMISHSNILYQVAVQAVLLPIGETDRQVSFLPFSHIGERLLGDYRHLISGSTVSFTESQVTIFEDVIEVAPTMFFGVPRIWEKFHAVILSAIVEAPALLQRVYGAAFAVGNRVAERRLGGKGIPKWLGAIYFVTDKLLLKRLKRLIGMHRTQFVISGGAPIETRLLKWFFALGLDMRETYGLTESTGVVSIPPLDQRKVGTVGKAMPGSEIRIAADCEILVRGPQVFLGYFGKDQETAKVLKDGWLSTGDLGQLDEEGFLTITGRKKDIIITAAGKNISPAEIENQLRFSPYIADAMVIGDGRKYLTCLITINFETLSGFARDHDLQFGAVTELCHLAEIKALIQAEVDKTNRLFARSEQIKRFHLLDKEFQPGDEEMTPTMKLKREVIAKKFSDLIEALYCEQ